MAPLNPNSSGRMWFDYVSRTDGPEHTLMVRHPNMYPSDVVPVQQLFYNWLLQLGANFFRAGWRIIRARYATVGSDISLETSLISQINAFVGTNSTGAGISRDAVELRFVGRSPTTGRRGAISLYGVKAGLSIEGFRVEAGASGDGLIIANAVSQMNGSSADAFRCIDGSIQVFAQYANIQYNSYWERRIRING